MSNDNVAADLYGTKTRTCSECGYADTVPDYSLCKVGDIILKDGTICSIDDYITDSNTAVAVIVRAASEEKPAIGVGIVRYGSRYMQWCSENAIGRKEISGLNLEDGSGAWEILKEKCSDAENHPEYYPAWNYSLKYAETNNLEGYLAEGWYLPSLVELETIYKNKETIDASLLKVGKEGFGSRTYWSCCQSGRASNFALLLNFKNGSSEDFYKNNATNYYCVCSIKAFN